MKRSLGGRADDEIVATATGAPDVVEEAVVVHKERGGSSGRAATIGARLRAALASRLDNDTGRGND